MQTTSATSTIKTLMILFLVFAALHFAQEFLIPIFVGGLIATILLPVSQWLESKKVPKGIAVFFCILLLLAFIASIFSVLGWQISVLQDDYPTIKEKSITTFTKVQEFIFSHLGISEESQLEMLKSEQPSIGNILQLVGGSLIGILTSFILTVVYIFCILYYRNHIKNFVLRLSKKAMESEVEKVIYNVTQVSQQYLIGLMKMIGLLWIMYSIGFSIIGVKNALFFAVICSFLEIVPFIGNITGTTFTVFVSAAQGGSLTLLVGIVVTYMIVQLIQGWILEPLIVGPQVKINPFSTIIALVIGEMVWGLPGIFLAIPLTAMLKIIFDHIEGLQPYGFLIGEVRDPKEHKSFQGWNNIYNKLVGGKKGDVN